MATTTEPTMATGRATIRPPRQGITLPGLLLGLGLGGFVDGIVLHQLLQWHHMLTDYGEHASFPMTTVPSLQDNTRWDGAFHLSTWLFVTVGLLLLWRAAGRGARGGWRSLTGLMLAGWGVFNVVEGVIDHHVLSLHHVRDDVADPLWWDLGFLALGVALIAVGSALHRSEHRSGAPRAEGRGRRPSRPVSPLRRAPSQAP